MCPSLPVAHTAQSSIKELTLPRLPVQGGCTPAMPQQQQYRVQSPAGHQAYPFHGKLHKPQSQTQPRSQLRPDLDQSLHLPPKLSRVNLPESALRSLEMGSVLDHLSPSPLVDILNRIHTHAVPSGSPGKVVRAQPQNDQLPLGLERDTRSSFFPAVQDCLTTLCADQCAGSEWPGFRGDSSERQFRWPLGSLNFFFFYIVVNNLQAVNTVWM